MWQKQQQQQQQQQKQQQQQQQREAARTDSTRWMEGQQGGMDVWPGE